MNIDQLFNSRISTRKFKNEKISEKEILNLLEISLMAPSAVNYQPYKIIVINEEETLLKAFKSYPREWFKTAPQVLLICADHSTSWKRKTDDKDHGDIDVAILADHITLKAHTMGIGTCWVCNFDPNVLIEEFDLPSNLSPVVLLPFGYPEKELEILESNEKRRKNIKVLVTFNKHE